jgi:glutathione S-transferase
VRLYRIPFSTNVERVALALGHKGVQVEYVDVDPADRSEVRRVSGQELVPVLDDDGRIVVDSMQIVAYLEERHPERPLYPNDPSRRAEVLIFIDWFNRVWKRPPNELEVELRRPQPDRARIEELARAIRDALPLFDDLLAGRDYLFGDFSAADCAAFPFLKYAVIFDERDDELFHRILRDHQRLDGRYARLQAWIHRVDGHRRA